MDAQAGIYASAMKRLSRLIEHSLTSPSGPIYHYTDAYGLLGLVESRTLRASEASGMNDVAEVRQGWQSVQTSLSGLPLTPEVEQMLEVAQAPAKAQHEVFVLCASVYGDDANQWRLYADGARGYAVELDPAEDLGVVSKTALGPRSSVLKGFAALGELVTTTGWLHVLYSQAEVDAAVSELVNSFQAKASEITASSANPDEEFERYDELRNEAWDAMSTIAHLVKTPGFAGEHEVRVVAVFSLGSGHVHYRAGRYGVVGYIELAKSASRSSRVMAPPSSTTPLPALPIRSVRLGPSAPSSQVGSLGNLAAANDLWGLDIRVSDVPLR